MRIFETENYEAMSRKAANILAAQINLKPDCVLGLATGSTPIGLYSNLIEKYKNGDLDFSAVKTANLDEYVGLPVTHEQSYRYFMQDNLFDHVNILPENTNVPLGTADDPEAESIRYESVIEALGGVDIQLLGLGHNGHIGFNEPCDEFIKNTHVVDLTDRTIDANTRFFASRDEVPRRAITMGIRTIMRAKKIVIVVSGEDKADAVRAAVAGPVTPYVPSSILQLHDDVVLVGDKAALSKL